MNMRLKENKLKMNVHNLSVKFYSDTSEEIENVRAVNILNAAARYRLNFVKCSNVFFSQHLQ